MTLHYMVALTLLIVPAAWCYSAGAPEEACYDMVPKHHVDARSSEAPYTITPAITQVRGDEPIKVVIKGIKSTDTIKGFMMQARAGDTPVGQFEVHPNDPYIQTLSCGSSKANTVTHKKIIGDSPNELTFTWRAPPKLRENVTFRATIALNGGVFWVGKLSPTVKVN